jgi:TatD DNase family protein
MIEDLLYIDVYIKLVNLIFDKFINKLVDSHCHLTYFDNIEQIIKCAELSDVGILHTISTKSEEFDEIIKILDHYDSVYGSIGIHPQNSELHIGFDIDSFYSYCLHKKVVSIGEIGLDFYHMDDYSKNQESYKKAQYEMFDIQLDIAKKLNKPIVIHSRDADRDMIKILKNKILPNYIKGVMHCFTSSMELARCALDCGFYIGISGIVTFKNAKQVQEIASYVPIDRLLIETDAPFLAPVPKRGQKNEPSFVKFVAEFLSYMKNISYEEIRYYTTKNFFDLFFEQKMRKL